MRQRASGELGAAGSGEALLSNESSELEDGLSEKAMCFLRAPSE